MAAVHPNKRRRGAEAPGVTRQASPIGRRLDVLLSFALVGLTLAVFAPVGAFDFVSYDDAWFVTDNAAVTGGLSADGLRWALEHAYLGTGGPLTWISHMVDVQLYGLAASGHHITSLVLHLANTLLLFGVLRRLTGQPGASATVAALFAIHPLHVESVAWIAQRKDVLSTFFWLLAIAAYVSYASRPTLRRYAVVAALHVMGLLSKPMVATLPLTLLLLDVWPLARHPIDRLDKGRAWRLVLEKAPLAALSLLSLWAALRAQQALGAVAEVQALPLGVRLGNAAITYVAYIGKLVWPSGLAPHYPYRLDSSSAQVLGCLAGLAAITLAAWWVRRRVPAVPIGWAWYLGTLVPTIGIVQVGGHSMADRFTYVPAIGIFLAVVWGAGALAAGARSRRIGLPLAGALVLAALVVPARAQVMTWKDGLALWRHATEVAPSNARAHANLGATLAQAGRNEEAVSAYREALRLEPASPKVLRNLALALKKTGDARGAVRELERSLSIDPRQAAAHGDLADVLADLGDLEGASRHYGEAIRLDAGAGLPRMNLAMTLAQAGRLAEALPHALQAVALEPRRADWRFTTAMLLEDLGRREDALRQLEAVLEVSPGDARAGREIERLKRRQ
jgi:Flp pilus assembly protein TadD